MFEHFSIYVAIGLVASLALFVLLFQKFDLPGWCRRKYALHTRMRAIGFALIAGVAIAFLVGMLLAVLELPAIPAQVIEGAAIGFNCAVLVCVVRPAEPKGGNKPGEKTRRKETDSRGRRSKG